MKNLNLFRKSARGSKGSTLASAVVRPSVDRRSTVVKHLAFMLLFLLGSLNVWGADVITQSSFSNISSSGYNNYTCTGTSGASYLINFYKSSNTNMNFKKTTVSSGFVVTSAPTGKKIKSVTATFGNELNIYWSNTNYNTSAISKNDDESDPVSMTSGTACVPSSTATSFRLYSPSTAATVSQISIEWEDANSSTPTLTASPAIIDFGTVEQGVSVDAQTVAVNYANLSGSVTYSGLSGAFTATGTISASGDEITITPSTGTIGNYSQTLTIQSSTDSKVAEVTVKMNVVAPFDGLKLTFGFSSNPGEWPTTNSTTTSNYTYTLNEVDYTFALNNVKCNSGYLMLTSVAKLGLPAIEGYKLVKVEATNSSNCSTTTKVKVTSDETGTVIAGGEEQTWATTNTKYTYTLSETEANTMYYLYISNKNCQMVELTLYYEETEASAVAKPTISGTESFLESTEVTLTCSTEGAVIYYTTDATEKDAPSTETWDLYDNSNKPSLTETTTIYAAAKKDANWSEVNEKTFTKKTPITVAQALTIIGALPNKTATTEDYLVEGTISTITSVTVGGTAEYYISADGTTTNELQVYKGKYKNQANFASVDDIQVGDDVVIFGKLKKYNDYKELDQDNYVYSQKAKARLSWSAASYDAELGGSNSFPTLTNTNSVSVTYSSSNTDAATINASTGAISLVGVGTTTITASFAGNESYKANSASYTLNVAAAVIRADISFNVDGGTAVEGLTQQSNLPNPLPATSKAGKNFGGWYTDAEKTVAAVAGAAVTSTEAITLYAKWLDPYTVAEARAAIDASEGVTGVYATGIVSEIVTAYSSQNGNISYNISADGTTTADQLQAYKGKAAGGANFISADDVQVGDIVVVYGNLKKYNSIYEFDSNNQLYSLTRPVIPTFSITYVENGANEDIEDVAAATNLPNPLPTVTKNEKVFGGWFTTPTFDGGTEAVAGAALSNDAILYAKWNDLSPWASVYTSNITLSTEGGTSASVAKVIFDEVGEDGCDAIKAGTGSVYGAIKVTIPAQATKLHYHAYGWNGEAVTLSFTAPDGVTVTPASQVIESNTGVKSSTPFTLAEGSDPKTEAYHAVSLSGNTEEIELTFTATGGKRFVLFGVNQEGGSVPVLDRIEISGDLTNKSGYKAGDDLNMEGLTVNAIYTLNEVEQDPVDVTADVEWSYDALVENQTEVTVTATYGEKQAQKTITDLEPVASADPKIYVDKLSVNFGTVAPNASVDAQTITVTLTNVANATATLGGTNPGAFSITPASPAALTTSGDITISVVSTANVGTYSATITISDDAEAATSKVVNLSLIVEDVETPVLTTSKWVAAEAADLVDGAEVLITGVKEDVVYAMSVKSNNGNNRTAVAGTLDEGIFTPGENTMSFFLEANGDNFYIKTSNDKYLYNASTSGNSYLRTKDNNEDASWTIELSEGNAVITSVENTNRTLMRFNLNGQNSPLFNCYASGQQPVQLYVPKPAPEPVYEEVRSGLEVGRHYTVCLPKNITHIKGATFWNLQYKNAGNTEVYLVEETAPGAGKPYIIQATDTKLEVVYGEEIAANPVENGALRGTFTGINATNFAALEGTVYLLINNAIRPRTAGNYLDANRAYVRYDLLTVPQTQNFAPGKRVCAMPMAPQVATGVDQVPSDQVPNTKVLINGQLYIMYNGTMYNVQGQLVK